MTAITIERFDDYFRELQGKEPYSWQRRVAAASMNGEWPPAIDLPTGSGKTACIDIAIFALASQARRDVDKRIAPRRVFFCVNRRVIVDEAYQRATRIAKAIWQAEQGSENDKPVLRDVAAALRSLAGTVADDSTPPLDVLELRGGIYRDNRWARSVAQPTVICTTIDQLGSRLLFRGYGVTSSAAPIQAALIAYDSLIVLDEAHISEPFRQTLVQVQRYLVPEKWAEREFGIRSVRLVPMSATPPPGVKAGEVVRLDEEDRKNESLNDRLIANKPAKLCDVKDVGDAAAKHATALAEHKPTAIGVIVNHVPTAKDVYHKLRGKHPDAVVELVIGSMRPVDRDVQAQRLRTLVGPERPAATAQTCFVVATQCLEVGADYDFDALVTECASLDSLRQRFGRLNRAGRKDEKGKPFQAEAIILVAKGDVKPDNVLDDEKPLDKIYGNALARTWNWLKEQGADGVIDFGIDAFNGLLSKHGDNGRIPSVLLAPTTSESAPLMLPAYLDFWCQTAPRPIPDPDVSLFLHGSRRGEPDVQVCWRADLGEGGNYPAPELWVDVVELLPPSSAECMSVPISRLRRWLSDLADTGAGQGDLLGVAEDQEVDDGKGRNDTSPGRVLKHRGVLWRGVKDSELIKSPGDLRPGDTLVLPCSAGGWDVLGHLPFDSSNGAQVPDMRRIDRAEAAFLAARRRVAVRLHPTLRSLWPQSEAVDVLFDQMADPDQPPTTAELGTMLRDASDAIGENDEERADLLRELAKPSQLVYEEYPDGRGAVLMSRRRFDTAIQWLPALDDGDDEPSRARRAEPVTLTDHSRHVEEATRHLLSLLPLRVVAEACRLAAKLHDAGKADERFQAMLRRSDRTDVWLQTGVNSVLLAKSGGLAQTRSERRAAGRRAGLPGDFRHEMLSFLLAERSGQLPVDGVSRDLVLHLIASHHGYARPFAPVVQDDDPPEVAVAGTKVDRDDRLACPPHRLDSGVAERFWSLTRCFGWWGLAYLEAVLRLSDWQASAGEEAGKYDNTTSTDPADVSFVARDKNHDRTDPDNRLLLPGLAGSNPLGFLAALGILHALTRCRGESIITLGWQLVNGVWHPLVAGGGGEVNELLDHLESALGASDPAPWNVDKKLPFEGDRLRAAVSDALSAATHTDRERIDVLASFGVESLKDNNGAFRDTSLRMVRAGDSAGQGLLAYAARIRRETTRENLRRTLRDAWRYEDENCAMRWDPSERRDHALRWGDPSKEVTKSVRGANRLAIEAMSVFPTVPIGRRVETTGFGFPDERTESLTWPIWQLPASMDVVQSLLTLPDLQEMRPNADALRRRGVAAVYRCDRMKTGVYYWNFTQARRIA